MTLVVTNDNITDFNFKTDITEYKFQADLDTIQLQNYIQELLIFEQKNNLNIFLNIKNIQFEQKTYLFKSFLNNTAITNNSILVNIIMLLRTYNSFSDNFFDTTTIYVNSITEFLDLKLELKTELLNYIIEFSRWYYSIFSCAHKTEFNFLEDAKDIPKSFELIITSTDYITLSGIISKIKIEEIKHTYVVKNAYAYIELLSNKLSMASNFMNVFQQLFTK